MKVWGKIITIVAAVFFNPVVNAFESGSDYNSANMSYTANSTISQIVVFDSAMQAGGTLTFSVEAHAGGGRPLQHDTGQLKLEYYNGSTLLGSSTTSYATGNLLQMNAWSSGPGDNTEAWTTLSLTSTDCGSAGSCSSVTHVKVTMVGTDTSWWAGNYGPQWRVPTVTFTPTGGSAGSNILYNPEFGVAPNSTLAQGWTSSSSWGTCGTTSGSVMCTTTASGVTANMSGGGYDANGGTTSATAGGYTGTLSVTSFSGSSSGGSATVVSTTTTNQVTTSLSNGSSTSSSSTVYGTATSTDVVTYGAAVVVVVEAHNRGEQTSKTLQIDKVVTTTIQTPVTTTTTTVTPYTTTTTVTTPVTTTTTTTPVTVTTYSDGSTTTTNGTPVVTTSTSDTVTSSQSSGTTTTVSSNTVVDTQVSSTTTAYYTRIDQYDVLARTNSLANLLSADNLLNRHSVVDGTLSFRGNVDKERTVSFYAFGEKTASYNLDNYIIMSSRYGFGLDKLIKENLVVGLSLSKFDSNMGGNDATGSLTKDIFALNTTYVARNWIMSSQLGYANNVFTAGHSLPELGYSNSSKTSGNDYWIGARLYTPDLMGLRPFVGVRHENNRRDAVVDSGSALTAISYAAVNQSTNTNEYGIRYDKRFGTISLYGEVSQNSQGVVISSAGIGKKFNERVSLIVGATHLHANDIQNTAGSIALKIGF